MRSRLASGSVRSGWRRRSVEGDLNRLFLAQRGARRRLAVELRRLQRGLGARHDLVPNARQHRKKDPACAAELALDVAEETGRAVFGAVPRVDQSRCPAAARPGRRRAASTGRPHGHSRALPRGRRAWRARRRGVNRAWLTPYGALIRRSASIARPQPGDRGVESTEPAFVKRGVEQGQLHAPLVAAFAVERGLAQRTFDAPAGPGPDTGGSPRRPPPARQPAAAARPDRSGLRPRRSPPRPARSHPAASRSAPRKSARRSAAEYCPASGTAPPRATRQESTRGARRYSRANPAAG